MSVFLERQIVRRRLDWVAGLRQIERVLLACAIVLAGLVALYGLYHVVFLGSIFSVRKVVVEGNWNYLSAEGLTSLSGVREGDNLFWVRVGEVRERLRTNPWVKAASVHRGLPGTLGIRVEEQEPTALLLSDGRLFYVNAEARIFKEVETGDDKDFPILTGLSNSGDDESELTRKLTRMMTLIDGFRRSNLGLVSDVAEVNYDRSFGYSLITMVKNGHVEIVFGDGEFEEQLMRLERVIVSAKDHPGQIQYMLLNEPGRVIVKYKTSA